MTEQEKLWRKPAIPFAPTADGIIVKDLLVKSEIRKRVEGAKIARAEADIRNDELNAFRSGEESILRTFHSHPAQAVIVAVGPNVPVNEDFRVGSKIAYGIMDESNVFIFNKKIYMKLNMYNIIGSYKSAKR